jgi:phage terminase large subunit-like protein
LIDDQFFAYVCSLDDGDDPFADEPDIAARVWIKANPTLGQTIQPSYLKEQVTEAKGMPSKEGIVRRLNFSQWTDAASPWVSGDLWRACESDFDPDELRGMQCFGGLDLSGSRDLSSLVLAFPREGDLVDVLSWFWTPRDTMLERGRNDRVPYDAWANQGHIEAVPGRVIDYGYIARMLGELTVLYNIESVGFDPYRIGYLEQDLADQGVIVNLLSHGQGYYRAGETGLWMPRSIDLLERAVLDGTLRVRRNPVMTWCSASAVLSSDPKGNRIFDKRKSTGKIDGVVALAMALGTLDGQMGGADLSDFFSDPVIV